MQIFYFLINYLKNPNFLVAEMEALTMSMVQTDELSNKEWVCHAGWGLSYELG